MVVVCVTLNTLLAILCWICWKGEDIALWKLYQWTVKCFQWKRCMRYWMNSNITLIFSKWNGPWFTLEDCKEINNNLSLPFRPSSRLLKDAKRYEKLYKSSNQFIAVMLRTEHAVLHARKTSSRNITTYFNEVISLVRKIRYERRHDLTPMIAADIGKYGSNSWHWSIKEKSSKSTAQRLVKTMIQVLLKGQMSFDSWYN